MKCNNCGADYKEGASYCSECGSRVISAKKRICPICGTESFSDIDFCANCGANFTVIDPTGTETIAAGLSKNVESPESVQKKEQIHNLVSQQSGYYSMPDDKVQSDKAKDQPKSAKEYLKNLDLFSRIILIAGIVTVIQLFVSLFLHNGFAIAFSVIQLAGLIVAVFVHNGNLKVQNRLKFLIAAVSIFLIALNIVSYSWLKGNELNDDESIRSAPSQTQNDDSTTSKTNDTTVILESSQQKFTLYLEIDFIENLFFSRYNVILSVDDTFIATLQNGKLYTDLIEVSAGNHTLTLKEENGYNKSSATFDITTDTTFSCEIKASEDSIDIRNKSIKNSIPDTTTIQMIDTVGKLYSEAYYSLEKLGFGNVTSKSTNGKTVIDYDNWLVIEQNVAAQTELSKSENIVLTVISLEEYFKKTYQGKNVFEIQQLAENENFKIRFEDEHGDSLDTKVRSMDEETKKSWFATKVRQYTSENRTAVVSITNSASSPISEPSESEPSDKERTCNFHSSGDRNIAKKGTSGVYAFEIEDARNYNIYYIVDLDEGFAYYFTEGNGEETYYKVEIDSGDFNTYVLLTWHDGDQVWNEGLRFKWKGMPEIMILQDKDYFETRFRPTNLERALEIRDKKTMIDLSH